MIGNILDNTTELWMAKYIPNCTWKNTYLVKFLALAEQLCVRTPLIKLWGVILALNSKKDGHAFQSLGFFITSYILPPKVILKSFESVSRNCPNPL